jgi:hypothetical protein
MFDASGDTPAENNGMLSAETAEQDEAPPTWSVVENVEHAVGIIYRGAKMNPLFEPHRIELERGIGVAQVHATLALVGMLEKLDLSLRDLTTEVRRYRERAGR